MNMRLWALLVCAALCIGATPHHSRHAPRQQPLTAEAIERAQVGQGQKDNAALIVKAEVLLDRAGFSPGVIDGRDGDNYRKAVAAFQRQRGLNPAGNLDGDTFNALAATSQDPIMADYAITDADVKGPFTKNIPADFEAKAKLPALDYAGPRDELAERFHMSEALLATLNPGADFTRSGTHIVVTDVPQNPRHTPVAKVVIDKNARTLSAFDAEGNLVAFYPASIGSAEKPAPSGEFKVKGVAHNPTYHYDPRFAFKGVKAQHKFTIQPGPKNPVGVVWIDLTAPSYGIHGTPSPEKIGKTESHGCIRLTNWDALDLAGMVHRGTVVAFVG
jgi:lipoprotein-anchoring transpeptidase ErfK/SrfK